MHDDYDVRIAARYRRHQDFARRAAVIARRDGLPEPGSNEIRIHGPIKNDHFITTGRVMASFRLANGRAVALLEQLWSDDEHTHITARHAIVVDPKTGDIYDQGLFFQSSPGDLTSVMSGVEIELDHIRKQIAQEKRSARNGQSAAPNTHVLEYLARKSNYMRDLVPVFERAAEVFGVGLTSGLASNRQLFKIHPSSQIVTAPPGLNADA